MLPPTTHVECQCTTRVPAVLRFCRHYGPRNLTIAIVGDVEPEQVERLAVKYFGPWAPPASALASGKRLPALASDPATPGYFRGFAADITMCDAKHA